MAQTLENVLASHSRLQHNTETVQKELGRREQELVSLRRDRSVCLCVCVVHVYGCMFEQPCIFQTAGSERDSEATGRGGEAPRHHGNK